MATSAAPAPAAPKSPVIFQASRLTLELDLDSAVLEDWVKGKVQDEIQRQVAAALTLANSTATIP
jgi:hypothetical protein